MRGASRRRGLTLIEMLVVLVLLAAATTATLGMLARGNSSEREAAATLRSSLERAHLVARARGGAAFSGGMSIVITPMDPNASGETRVALPTGWRLHIECGGEPVEALRFDSLGFSPDAELVLSTRENTAHIFHLAGISGELYEAEEAHR